MPETTDTNTMVNIVHLSTVSVKPDGDSKTSKKLTIRTSFINVPLRDVIVDAIRTDNIRFQRTLRIQFDGLLNNSTVDRIYGAKVASTVITPEMAENAYLAKLANMTHDERVAELSRLSELTNASTDDISDKVDNVDETVTTE